MKLHWLALALLALAAAAASAAPVCTPGNKCGSELCNRDRNCYWQEDRNCGSCSYCYAYAVGNAAEDWMGRWRLGYWPKERRDNPEAWGMEAYFFTYDVSWSYWRYYVETYVYGYFDELIYGETVAYVTYGIVGKHCNCLLNIETTHQLVEFLRRVNAPEPPGALKGYTIAEKREDVYSTTQGSLVACGSGAGWAYYEVFRGKFNVGYGVSGQTAPSTTTADRTTLIIDAYVVESWRWWRSKRQWVPSRYGPQLIVPLKQAHFAGRNLPLYTLYFLHNATGIQPYAVEVVLEEPYVVVDAGWSCDHQESFVVRFGNAGGVAYLEAFTKRFPVTTGATSKPLTGTFTVFLKWEGFGTVKVYKGDWGNWTEVYSGGGDGGGASFTLTLNGERVRLWIRKPYFPHFAASIALARRVPGYTKGLRFVGWFLEYAYQSAPDTWYRVGVFNSTLLSGSAGSDRYGGSINRVRALYVFEPNLILSARLLGVPEGAWVNEPVTITGVIDGGPVSATVPVNGSRSAGFAVASSYSFTAPAAVAVTVRRVEAQIVNQLVSPNSRFWWDRFFSGSYTIIVESRPASGRFYAHLRVYTCRSLGSSRTCTLLGGIPSYPSRRTFEATFTGYIMVENPSGYGDPLSYRDPLSHRHAQLVNITMIKREPANAVFHHWEVDGELLDGATVSGSKPSGTSTLVAVYALEGYWAQAPVELLTNQTMLPPGAMIPNPIAYVPNATQGSMEHMGKRGWWLLSVTHAVTGKTSPAEAGFPDDKTWVWALISNGTESRWVPVTGVWRLNMTRDWEPRRHIRELPSGAMIMEWNQTTIDDFPRIEEPQAHRGWHLIALSAWRTQIEELGQGYNTSSVWLTNGSTLALYNVTFAYMGVDGRRVEYVFWQPIAVSTLALKAEARYELSDHDPILGRRRILMSIHANVTWKYTPPLSWQLLGFRVHAPQLGFAVSLEEPGCTSTACIGYWSTSSPQAGSTWRLYVLQLGDTEDFYAKAYPQGLLGGDGYSSVRSFRLTIRWLGAGNHPANLVWGSERISFQMAPATVYKLEWSDPTGPFTATYGCFAQGPAGLTPQASYEADLTFDWGATGSTHPLKGTRSFPGVNSPCRVSVHESADDWSDDSADDQSPLPEDWIAFYFIPAEGRYTIAESALVPVPLVAKYPPRG